MTKYFFSFVLICICADVYGQAKIDTTKLLDVTILKQDFKIFRDSLEKIHPALYRYRNKQTIDKLFDSCYTTITPEMTEIQFYMLLRFMTSAIEDDDESYFGRFIDSAFKEINSKGISKLIIDLRNNAGGEDSYGAILFSYLTDKPFPYYSSLKTISYTYPKSAHPNLEMQIPNKNNFKGECFFLINGKSFSTTSEFCAIAKSNNRGKFIGTETGGGYYGNTGGEHAKFTLPDTRIVVIIPKRRYDLAVKPAKYKDRGTIADYYIDPTIMDIINKKDVQLNYAIKLADKNNSR